MRPDVGHSHEWTDGQPCIPRVLVGGAPRVHLASGCRQEGARRWLCLRPGHAPGNVSGAGIRWADLGAAAVAQQMGGRDEVWTLQRTQRLALTDPRIDD